MVCYVTLVVGTVQPTPGRGQEPDTQRSARWAGWPLLCTEAEAKKHLLGEEDEI
jgi:hypothetical protein